MRQMLRKQAEKTFGPLSAEVVRQLGAVSFNELDKTPENMVTVQTLAALSLPPAPPPEDSGDPTAP
jgi:hypothetical protein